MGLTELLDNYQAKQMSVSSMGNDDKKEFCNMQKKMKKNLDVTPAKHRLLCLVVVIVMFLTACSGGSQTISMATSTNSTPSAVSDATQNVTQNDSAGLPQGQQKYTIEEMNPQISGSVYRYSEGMGGVKYNEKYGYLGPDGKVAIDPQYRSASPFRDGYAAVEKDDGYAMIDTTGKELFVIQTDRGG